MSVVSREGGTVPGPGLWPDGPSRGPGLRAVPRPVSLLRGDTGWGSPERPLLKAPGPGACTRAVRDGPRGPVLRRLGPRGVHPSACLVSASLADGDLVHLEGRGGPESEHPPALQSRLACHRLASPLGMDRSPLSTCLGGRGCESGLRFSGRCWVGQPHPVPASPERSLGCWWVGLGAGREVASRQASAHPPERRAHRRPSSPKSRLPSDPTHDPGPWGRRADPPPVTGRSPGCRDPSVRWVANTGRCSPSRRPTSRPRSSVT